MFLGAGKIILKIKKKQPSIQILESKVSRVGIEFLVLRAKRVRDYICERKYERAIGDVDYIIINISRLFNDRKIIIKKI